MPDSDTLAGPSPQTVHPLRRFSIPVLFFLVTLVLVHPAFFPNLSEINPWDEAGYINGGRTLMLGQLPPFKNSPLVHVFYALMYLPFRASPHWLVLSATLGRFTLFSFLWLSAYLVAGRFRRWTHPLVAAGLILVTPLAVEMLRFPSDPLFAGMAGLSFWQLLGYFEEGERRHLWQASMFMGLAALSRNDGLVLFVLLAALALFAAARYRALIRALVPTLLPFLGLVGGYVLLYGSVTGNYDMGTVRRTYDNFEAGHQVIYAGTGALNAVVESKLESQRVFGSGEENNYSVLRAIQRNPQVYLQRLLAVSRTLPRTLLEAYGIRFAALLLLLAVRGAVTLVRDRAYLLLGALVLWPLHLATGFVITLFRPGHLQFPYYAVFSLAAVGLGSLARGLDSGRERYVWYAALGALTVYGLVDNKLAIYYGAVVFLVAVMAAVVLRWGAENRQVPLFLTFLAAGLVIHGNFPAPKVRTLGQEAREQAVVFMTENLPQGTKVAAGAPGVVWSARMTYSGLASKDVPSDKNPEEFLDWMVRQNIKAVYVDHSLYNSNPLIWGLIKENLGQGVERVFSADQGDIQVLLIEGGD